MNSCRVTRRTFTFTDGTNDYYDVHLELSVRGISQTGGGNPGRFPYPPSLAPVHWWTFDFLVPGDGGYTDTPEPSPVFDAGATYNYEITGENAWGNTIGGLGGSGTYSLEMWVDTTFNILNLVFTNGSPPGAYTNQTISGSVTIGDSSHGGDASGYARGTVADDHSHTGRARIHGWVDPDGWDDGSTPQPPSPGQWVRNEYATPAADNATTTFYTAWPFADGSLQVRISGVQMSASIVSYDGAAGSFVLAFAPTDAGEQPLVDYQGR